MHFIDGKARTIIVFFASPPQRTCRGKILNWIIRTASRSAITHCAIGWDNVVIEPSPRGIRRVRMDTYVTRYPGLWGFAAVKVSTVDTRLQTVRYYPWLGVMLRAVAPGLFQPFDCVGVVVAVLRRGGVVAPPWVASPRQLLNWLRQMGYHVETVQRLEHGSTPGDR